MDFNSFSKQASNIESTDADNEKISLVANLFSEADTESLPPLTRFIRGDIFPAWDDRKMGVGPSLLYRAIADAADIEDEDKIENLVAEHGGVSGAVKELDFDLSSGQQSLASFDDTSSYTVKSVYDVFEEIAEISGAGSTAKKQKLLSNVILDCSEIIEIVYFSRLVLGEMRIGVGDGTVRDAIAEAFNVSEDVIKHGIMVTNDTGVVAEVARKEGEAGVRNLDMKVGRPVSPMLAKDGSIDELLEKVATDGNVAVEPKFDGVRLQIHLKGDCVSLYSRNLNEETESLPEIVSMVKENVDTDQAILDAEVIAFEDGEPLSFQEVMRRFGRKHDIEEKAEEIKTVIRTFDVIYVDGDVKINQPYTDRRSALLSVCDKDIVTDAIITDSKDEILEYQQQALNDGNEGVMIKNPASQYLPSNRGWNWAKLKPETETLDCMVVGGEWGEGNRSGQFGSFLLAVRNDDTGKLETIGKVATGITEDRLQELTDRFEPLITSADGKEVSFKPEIVFEVGVEEIQPSPQYSSGYGIRFPRFIGVREDKDRNNIDTLERIEDLYEKQ